VTVQTRTEGSTAFRHEAFMYAGQEEFVEGTASFIADGLAQDEAVLVVVSAAKIELLRDALGANAADRVAFADMAAVGRNPARIIPAWQQFVAEQGIDGRNLRGIGEPIYPERSAAELAECHLHESLLNVAFEGGRPWWLLCPYDVEALDPAVVEEAQRTHPYALGGQSAVYRALDVRSPFDAPLPGPRCEGAPGEVVFAAGLLRDVRTLVVHHAERIGLGPDQTSDLVLAVNEIATNSLRHGGGSGVLRIWEEDGTLICEINDGGWITEPLIGRSLPPVEQQNGRGLWLANQLCDLVQLSSSADGTVIRLHMRPDS
jgi:anti-sigma regulatory factor (Ser/Thr protein kinase)